MSVTLARRLRRGGERSGPGYWIPTGSLDRWRAARALHASQRVDIVAFGDSTTVGETPFGPETYYSWFSNRLRELAVGAGLTDGGRGLAGRTPGQDFANNNGDGLTGVQSHSGWSSFSDTLLMGFSAGSTAVGNTIRFQGYGTYVRLIWRAAQFVAYGKFTYSLDGGAAVTVTPNPSARYQYVVLGPFAEGLHTLDIENIGGATPLGDGMHERVSVMPDWFRGAGLVWHNHAVSGQSAAAYVAANNKLLPVSMGLLPAGVGSTNDWETAIDPSGDARKVRLDLFNLGINDSDDANIATAINKYARTARQAGADPLVCIPALEDKASGAKIARQSAIKAQCYADRVPWVDFGVAGALGPTANWNALYGIGSLSNPHLTEAAYSAQADYLWSVALAV